MNVSYWSVLRSLLYKDGSSIGLLVVAPSFSFVSTGVGDSLHDDMPTRSTISAAYCFWDKNKSPLWRILILNLFQNYIILNFIEKKGKIVRSFNNV